jgi:hypothetical protein
MCAIDIFALVPGSYASAATHDTAEPAGSSKAGATAAAAAAQPWLAKLHTSMPS